jgi:hypothetical protein
MRVDERERLIREQRRKARLQLSREARGGESMVARQFEVAGPALRNREVREGVKLDAFVSAFGSLPQIPLEPRPRGIEVIHVVQPVGDARRGAVEGPTFRWKQCLDAADAIDHASIHALAEQDASSKPHVQRGRMYPGIGVLAK